jgi:ABC-2 type transport system permease protein
VGFLEAIAYRAEMLVWILSTTMPLVMLALWSAVARDAPMGRFGQSDFTAYFLATFVVRQLTGSWLGWQINFEVRDGTLATRLLRPVHPLFAYATENVAAMPVRFALALPLATVLLFVVSGHEVTRDPLLWVAFALATLGGWLVTLLVNFALGALALFTESSMTLLDVWAALWFVFSGYLIPVELFPPRVRAVLDWLPFRYQIGLPVELMTGAHDRAAALALLAGQWAWVAGSLVLCIVVWRAGVKRFAAYGG